MRWNVKDTEVPQLTWSIRNVCMNQKQRFLKENLTGSGTHKDFWTHRK